MCNKTILAGSCVDKVGLQSGTAWTGTSTMETCAVFDADPTLCDTLGYEDYGEGTANKHCCACTQNDFCVDNPGKLSNGRFFDVHHRPCWVQFAYTTDLAGQPHYVRPPWPPTWIWLKSVSHLETADEYTYLGLLTRTTTPPPCYERPMRRLSKSVL